MCVRNAISHLQVTTYQTRPPIKDLSLAHSNDRLTTTADLAHPDTTFYLLSWSGDTVASYVFEQAPKHTAVNFYFTTAFSVSLFRGRRRQRRLLQTVHKVGSVSLLLTGFLNKSDFPGMRFCAVACSSESAFGASAAESQPLPLTPSERGQRRQLGVEQSFLRIPQIGDS